MRKMTVFLTFLNHFFPNHSKTMILKMKVDIHVFSAVEVFNDLLSLEHIISDIEPNVSNKQKNLDVSGRGLPGFNQY